MLTTFAELRKHLKLRAKVGVIENPVFKLHYRVTFLIFLVGTVLVSSRQYIGEHIRCIVDAGVPTHVVETYCFFTTTFTVVRYLNASLLDGHTPPHPGIGPYQDPDPVVVHAYYQWVPFVLFGQGLLFYLPHFLWKRLEGGRVLALVSGFENAALALGEGSGVVGVPSKRDLEERVACVRRAFLLRVRAHRDWAAGLVLCELLNAVNLGCQVMLMDGFLRGGFLGLGPRVLAPRWEYGTDPLDVVFPKVTKCTFHKYGPTGSIQTHDALCVMALNIINEKIYTFLWFWCVILGAATAAAVAWRAATAALHRRSRRLNAAVFGPGAAGAALTTVARSCTFADWLFLSYIGASMDGFVFRELLNQLALEMEEQAKRPGEGEGEPLHKQDA